MALDGFVVDLPDTEENEKAFGRPGSGRAPGAFPQAHVLAFLVRNRQPRPLALAHQASALWRGYDGSLFVAPVAGRRLAVVGP